MLAAIADNGSVRIVERDIPDGDGVLVRVTSSGICGSDLHLLSAGVSGVVMGHEFGGITHDGRLVAVRPTGECGACAECGRGLGHLCRDAGRALLGISRDGGLAEWARVEEARLVEVPTGVDPGHVGLVEPLAVVVHGVGRVNPEPGSRALVVGAGSIGLLCGAVLADRGLRVDIATRHPHQRIAAEKLGLTPLDPGGGPVQSGYDSVYDAVCTQESFDTCVGAVRPRGSLLEFGMFWSPVAMSNTLLMKEVTLLPSIFYSHDHANEDFTAAADLLRRRPQTADAVITHRFTLSDAPEALRTAADRASGAIKVHLFP